MPSSLEGIRPSTAGCLRQYPVKTLQHDADRAVPGRPPTKGKQTGNAKPPCYNSQAYVYQSR